MHQYYEQAEELVKQTIDDLKKLLPRDGEDISYYNPEIFNNPIKNLIDAKVLMACANEATGRNSGYLPSRIVSALDG